MIELQMNILGSKKSLGTKWDIYDICTHWDVGKNETRGAQNEKGCKGNGVMDGAHEHTLETNNIVRVLKGLGPV